MARPLNKLTDAKAKSAKFRDRRVKLSDGGGLYLDVQRSGKYWRLKYRFAGKERLLALGVYPEVSLAKARERRDEARALLRDGIDPGVQKRLAKNAQLRAAANTFQYVALEWYHEKHKHEVVIAHSTRNLRRLERHVFPILGRRPIKELQPPEILEVLRRIEKRGHLETTSRVKTLVSAVFRYAVATGRVDRDATADLKGAFKSAKTKHHPALVQPDAVGQLLRAMEGYNGQPETERALLLAPLLIVRPGELRKARWSEIDLGRAQWSLSAKGEHPLIVPLSRQAQSILSEMQSLSGDGDYIFPGKRGQGRPMSENTINKALGALGYGGIMTGHGFRAMARTMLTEQLGFPVEIVEKQLGHKVRDVHGQAYNRTQWLPERREMMQAWADYLDALRDRCSGSHELPGAVAG